jgi:NADPH-dependent curcumin reductase
MDTLHNRRLVLARRPQGEPKDDDFLLETSPVPELQDGEVLLKNLWLSIDPYMRGRMNDAKSYAKPVEIGEVMVGGTIAEVVRSKAKGYQRGDLVSAYGGWQEYQVSQAEPPRLLKIDAQRIPAEVYLGAAGMPGQTAYFGLTEVGRPKPGETVVVSSAAGAVGSVVGQLAMMLGCKVVGIAGGPEKCGWVRDRCGFACVDYKAGDLPGALRAACPDGVDIYFENVGGPVLDAVAPLLNDGARVPICGIISLYNASGPQKTPFDVLAAHPKKPEHRFFVVTEWADRAAEVSRKLAGWVEEGKLAYRHDIVSGLLQAPAALRGVLAGRNTGKMLVKLADPE